jgi:hypothetical protein
MADPIIVFRPASIWDSRDPFANFLVENRSYNLRFASATLAIERIATEVTRPTNRERHLRKILGVSVGNRRAGIAWLMYGSEAIKRARRAKADGDIEQVAKLKLSLRERQPFLDALGTMPSFLQTSIIVLHSAMFETYVLAWWLNYVLANLEDASCTFTPTEEIKKILRRFQTSERLPSGPEVLRTFPSIWTGLEMVPHVSVNPRTGQPVDSPLSPQLNARESIRFWRAYRNHVVHHAQVITPSFAAEWNPFWRSLSLSFHHGWPDLVVGRPLFTNEDILRAYLTTHARAARWLNDELLVAAHGRRGHPNAPSLPVEEHLDLASRPPKPLIMHGDHVPSLLGKRASLKRPAAKRSLA